MSELLSQGLIITVLGITLVFAGLGLLWGAIELMMRLMPPEVEKAEAGDEMAVAEPVVIEAVDAAACLTAERARVAAIAAAAVLAQALPPGNGRQALGVPALPEVLSANGHDGATWISAHRVRALQSWQPAQSNHN